MIELLLFLFVFCLSLSNGFILTQFFERQVSYLLFPVYIVLGIVITTLVVFFLSLLGLPFFSATILSFCLAVWERKSIRIPKFSISKVIPVIIISLLSVIFLGWIGVNQGYKNGNLYFFTENAHDGLWHIALQGSLMNSVPPENPIYSGEILKGYHYFADLFWAYLSHVSGLRPETIYTVFLPIFLPLLFGLTTISLLSVLTRDKVIVYLVWGILVFGSGLSFFVPYFFPGGSNNQSSFWLDQPVGYIINPHLLLSFSLVNTLFFMLVNDYKKWKILIGIVMASLVVIKVYAFLILAPILGFLAILMYLKRRELDLLISSAIVFFLSVGLIVSSNVGGGFPFIYEPGWFIKSMFETSDHLNASWWELQRQVFAADNNYLRLLIHWFYGFSVFVAGNLGLKVLGLAIIPLLLLTRFKYANKDRLLIFFSLGIVIISFTIPTLFIQKGVAWSSIQFLHFSQLPLCILLFLLLKNFKRNTQIVILTCVLLLGLPTTISAFLKTIDSSNYISYSSEIVSGFEKLENLNTKLTVYTTEFTDTSIVPALSGQPTYFTDQNMLGILQVNFEPRKNYINMIAATSICPGNSLLVTGPASTASGKIIYKSKDIKIIECNK